jgi:hypothetical protein
VRNGGHCIVRGGACPAATTRVFPLYQLISQILTNGGADDITAVLCLYQSALCYRK